MEGLHSSMNRVQGPQGRSIFGQSGWDGVRNHLSGRLEIGELGRALGTIAEFGICWERNGKPLVNKDGMESHF